MNPIEEPFQLTWEMVVKWGLGFIFFGIIIAKAPCHYLWAKKKKKRIDGELGGLSKL